MSHYFLLSSITNYDTPQHRERTKKSKIHLHDCSRYMVTSHTEMYYAFDFRPVLGFFQIFEHLDISIKSSQRMMISPSSPCAWVTCQAPMPMLDMLKMSDARPASPCRSSYAFKTKVSKLIPSRQIKVFKYIARTEDIA
jgi:hypothetical protein